MKVSTPSDPKVSGVIATTIKATSATCPCADSQTRARKRPRSLMQDMKHMRMWKKRQAVSALWGHLSADVPLYHGCFTSISILCFQLMGSLPAGHGSRRMNDRA